MPCFQTDAVTWCLTEAGSVDDGPQPRHAGERVVGEQRGAPVGEQDLHGGQFGGVHGVEVGDGSGRVEGGDPGQTVQCALGDERAVDLGSHGEGGPRAAGGGRQVRAVREGAFRCEHGHFTAPAVRPERQKRWRQTKATISGTTATSDPVITSE